MVFNSPFKEQGFTLVEMLVVMTIAVGLAGIAVKSGSDLAFVARYEQTQATADNIKSAIIGYPGNRINGQPDISGYVADMGRTPEYLRDLLQAGYCRTAATVYINHESEASCKAINAAYIWNWATTPCIKKSDSTNTTFTSKSSCIPTATYVWIGTDADTTNTKLKYGWNGPYLQTSKLGTDQDALGDGWGNKSDDNYGWAITQASYVGDSFSIESWGKDQADGPNNNCYDGTLTVDPYSEDCINSTAQMEYTKTIDYLSIKINADAQDASSAGFCTTTLSLNEASCTTTTTRKWDDNTALCIIINSDSESDCGNIASERWDKYLNACTIVTTEIVRHVNKVLSQTDCNSAIDRVWDTDSNECVIYDSLLDVASCLPLPSRKWEKVPLITGPDVCVLYAESTKKYDCIDGVHGRWDFFSKKTIPETQDICMRIYFRIDGEISSPSAISTNSSPITINRDGSTQDVTFEFDSDSGTTGVQASIIPNGINAIGIYKYDTATSTCTTDIYPTGHTLQHVTFAPYKTVNNLVW